MELKLRPLKKEHKLPAANVSELGAGINTPKEEGTRSCWFSKCQRKCRLDSVPYKTN